MTPIMFVTNQFWLALNQGCKDEKVIKKMAINTWGNSRVVYINTGIAKVIKFVCVCSESSYTHKHLNQHTQRLRELLFLDFICIIKIDWNVIAVSEQKYTQYIHVCVCVYTSVCVFVRVCV